MSDRSLSDESFVQLALREFRQLKRLADRALAQISDEEFRQASKFDNSIAVVVKHLAGNMHSRWRDFLTSDGEKSDRNRDMEFVLIEQDTRSRLTDQWESGWNLMFEVVESLDEEDLRRTVTIRGEPLTCLQAIHRQLTHYAYHVGQIVFLAKHFAGERWESLTIPKGESEAFNRHPRRYLTDHDGRTV